MARAEVRVGKHRYAISAPEGEWIGVVIRETRRPYEHDLLRTLAPFASTAAMVVDVGANIGNHSLYFAIVRGATVHAFEPNPEALRYLRANIAASGVQQIHVHGAGLSDFDGRGRIATGDELGMTQLVPDDSGEIDVRRLDSFGLSSDRRIGVMKIDVEGAETRVLKGAEATIRTNRPVIAMEMPDPDAADLLSSLGYRRFPLRFCGTPTYVFYPRPSHLPLLTAFAARAKMPEWRARARARLARDSN